MRELFILYKTTRGNNSAVECNLAKVEVAGSNPVSRSIKTLRVASAQARLVRDLNGGIAKW